MKTFQNKNLKFSTGMKWVNLVTRMKFSNNLGSDNNGEEEE